MVINYLLTGMILQVVVISGVSYKPYKWPKINGFSWCDFTLLIGAPCPSIYNDRLGGPPCRVGIVEYCWNLGDIFMGT